MFVRSVFLQAILYSLVAASLLAQNKIDLGRQGKNFDFKTASSTSPFKTGAALPSACAVGDVFFNTASAPGQNFFACTAVNQWSAQTVASALTSVFGRTGVITAQTGDYAFGQISGSLGDTQLPNSAAAAGTYGSSSAIPQITLDTKGRVIAISTAPASSSGFIAGPGISINGNTLSTDPSIPTLLTSSATLDFPTLAASSCSAGLSIALTGATEADAVAPGWPSTLPAGILGMMRVSAGGGSISVSICNLSGASVDVPAALYRASIIRAF